MKPAERKLVSHFAGLVMFLCTESSVYLVLVSNDALMRAMIYLLNSAGPDPVYIHMYMYVQQALKKEFLFQVCLRAAMLNSVATRKSVGIDSNTFPCIYIDQRKC